MHTKLQACYKAWQAREMNDAQQLPAKTPVGTCTQVEFNKKHYLQTFGTGMGECVAPYYANIFMGDLEEGMLETARIKQSTISGS